MQRIIMALVIIGSFNIIAIQLFMTGNIGPLRDVLPYQQALMISALFTVIVDIVLVYMMMTMGSGQGKGFDAIFKKYYDGHNFDEAFQKATKEFKKRL